MTEIPDDIMAKAREIAERVDMAPSLEAAAVTIAAALLSERETMKPDELEMQIARAVLAEELLAASEARVAELENAFVVTDEMVKRAEDAGYKRHERGFLLKPLIWPLDMRAAIDAALTPTKENTDAE